MLALAQRLDDPACAFCHADYGLGPRQVPGAADGDVRIRRAEHADHPLRVLLSPLGYHQSWLPGRRA